MKCLLSLDKNTFYSVSLICVIRKTLNDPPDASLSNIPVASVSIFAFNVVLPQQRGVNEFDGLSGGVLGPFWIMKLVSFAPFI